MTPHPARTALPLAVALSLAAATAHATNGMNLEGFGPIGLSMGGASMAYDSGLAAMMNNPATLGLAPEGDQLALALHFLGPDVAVQGLAESGGDAYYMPALGWGRKAGRLTWGVGMFAQGGMGTEYPADSPLAMGTGQPVRSELGVGRVILPVAYEFSPRLIAGATLDYVWAGLDMRAAFAPGGPRIDFSDDNDFTGRAKGTGFAGKLGLLYKLSPSLNLGLTYHSKTALSDLETKDNGATFAGMTGKATIHDFEWPETYAVGLAWQADPKLMLAVDVKYIGWSDDMKDFKLAFTPAGGSEIPLTMAQNWDDQVVYALGLQYRPNDKLGLRVGFNYGRNPVPDATLNPLFPAIVERHYTAGFDYRVSDQGCIAVAVAYAPEVSNTNGSGMTIRHSQLSGMVGYNHQF